MRTLFLFRPGFTLRFGRAVLQKDTKTNSLYREHFSGRKVPDRQIFEPLVVRVWADAVLKDIMGDVGFYSGFFISDKFKQLLVQLNLPADDTFFMPAELRYRGKSYVYWWFQVLPLTDEDACVVWDQSVFYFSELNSSYQKVTTGPFIFSNLKEYFSVSKSRDRWEQSKVGLTRNAWQFDLFRLWLIGLNGIIVTERFEEAFRREGITGAELVAAPWLLPVDMERPVAPATPPEKFGLYGGYEDRLPPGIPPKGIEPPFDFSAATFPIWKKNALSTLAVPTKKKTEIEAMMDQYARPCAAAIAYSPDLSEESWKLNSRIAGKPMLPAGFSWPLEAANQRPLAFLCQINVAQAQGLPGLPEKGLFSFFADVYDSENGWAMQAGRFAVYFFDNPESLKETDFPDALPINADVEMKALGFVPYYDFPDYAWIDQYKPPAPTAGTLEWFTENHDYLSNHRMQLLGYAKSVQNYVGFDAVMVRDYAGRWAEYEQHKAEITEKSKNWVLLMQVYAPYLGLEDFWGDAEVYFLIQKEHLEKGDYSAIQVVFQNT
ncbi:MAG: DUF1963 domain-containing protein [Saprospiraceae bacterium]|nr:DUF1963 domain-containing protein [Saprospiraceae bacterium]